MKLGLIKQRGYTLIEAIFAAFSVCLVLFAIFAVVVIVHFVTKFW